MRVRTLLTLTTGAAIGAGAMYLLDPEHGPERRREARRNALRSARAGAVHTALDLQKKAGELAVAAMSGYRQARSEGQDAPWT